MKRKNDTREERKKERKKERRDGWKDRKKTKTKEKKKNLKIQQTRSVKGKPSENQEDRRRIPHIYNIDIKNAGK